MGVFSCWIIVGYVVFNVVFILIIDVVFNVVVVILVEIGLSFFGFGI